MYKQALDYKEKGDMDNYLLCLLQSNEDEAEKEYDDILDDEDLLNKINLSKILPIIEKLAEENKENADKIQYVIAHLYFHGIGVKQDDGKAIHYYTLSANNNNLHAQFELACIYGDCYGGDYINMEKAIYYYNLCIEKKYTCAMNNLFLLYLEHKNYDRAVYCYHLCIKYGNKISEHILAHLPEIEFVKYELKQKITENEKLRKENEQLKAHIIASPDGELYFEAKSHYDDQLSKNKHF